MSARVCSQCGTANDPTRVFCTNCGARLDESAASVLATAVPSSHVGRSAPQLASARQQARSAARHRAIQPARSSGVGGRLVSQVLLTAALAAILAAIVQIGRTPDGLPAVQPPNAATADDRIQTLHAGAASPTPSLWVVNEDAANETLASLIQMRPNASGAPVNVRFVRSAVALRSGAFDFLIQQNFLGRDLYFTLRGVVVTEPQGGCRVDWVGGFAGRLPIAPQLLPAFTFLFGQVFLGLEQTTAALAKARAIRIEPGKATVEWPGASGSAVAPPRGASAPPDPSAAFSPLG